MIGPHRAHVVERASGTRVAACSPVVPGVRFRVAVLRAFAVAVLIGIAAHPAAGGDQPRRIYFLESLRPTQAAALRTIGAFERRLAEKTSERFEIFIDYMELGRFPSQANADRTAQYLAGKYAEAPPDVLIPLGRAAVPFMIKYRDVIAPRVPTIIASVTNRDAAEAGSLADTVFVTTEYNFGKTLELARRLQPDARDLVLIGGATDYDRLWLEDARRGLAPYLDRFTLKELVGLPYDEMLSEVSKLPRDTIVLVSFIFADATGRQRVPPEVAEAIAKAAAAPVYAPISTFFGRGIIGGYMDSYEGHGVAAADVAFNILSGKPIATLDRLNRPNLEYHVDARQLERWGLSAKNLPPDAVVSYRQPTIWEQHRNAVLAGLLVFALQTVLVGFLLVQRARRQKAETLLKESDERMTVAAGSVNLGLWQFDPESGEFWATEHCRVLFNLASHGSLTRAAIATAIHPDDREMFAAALLETSDSSRPTVADVRVVLPDYRIRWIRMRARSSAGDGAAPGRLSGTFIDITDQKVAEAEAALQRQEVTNLMRVSTLGELSGAIAHEINQPLTAILSNAQAALHLLAQNKPDLGEIRDALNDIVHEENRADEVIHRLRNLLKKGERKSEPVDLNKLINSTIALLNSELITRRIKVETDLANPLPQLTGDSVQLQQALLNLVMNAMDAMAETPVAQRLVTIATRTAATGRLEVSVKDRGTSIKFEELGQVFQPFYTTKDHGLGLGLTICSAIVEAHGGTLTLANDKAGGARATFSLPAQEMLMAAQ